MLNHIYVKSSAIITRSLCHDITFNNAMTMAERSQSINPTKDIVPRPHGQAMEYLF